MSVLKQLVREVGLDAREIFLEACEVDTGAWGRMRIRLREEIELRTVDLKAVDLLMMECMSAYDGGGTKELPARSAQAGVGCERSVFCEPGADCALGDLAMVSPSHDSLCFGQRVAKIEC